MVPKFFRPVGDYLVSEYGKVWSTHTNKFLNPFIVNGYSVHNIKEDGVKVKRRTHRLVAEAWLPPNNSPNKVINHIDGDRLNNHYSNLEWVTRAENNRKKFTTILNEESVKEIKNLYKKGGYTHRDLARLYGVDHSVITRVLNGDLWW